VVAVAGGRSKHRAVLGALRTKLIDVIVTDAGCARFALA
jgi:DNA-binding transcriptional regulator LsrR (DeoR family)